MKWLLALIGILFMIPSGVWAQEDSLEDLLEAAEEIVVTVASKTAESVYEAPSTVTVFTHAQIVNMGINSVQELLNFVPGFQTTRDIEQGTAYRMSARGRSTALSESVLFLINGQRMNDLYTGGVSILNRHIAVENIKQIEVIRGPGSALYGSNAFLGVVNIITLEQGNELFLTAGTPDYRAASINMTRKSGEFSFSGFVKMFSDQGQEYTDLTDAWGRTGESRDPIQGMDGTATIRYGTAVLHLRHMERQLNGFLTFGNLSTYTNDETTRQSSLHISYQPNLFDNLETTVHAGYSWDRWRTLSLLIPRGAEIAPGFTLDEDVIGGPLLESYHANAAVDFTYQISDHNGASFGISVAQTGISDVANLFNHHPISLEYRGDVAEYREDGNFNAEETRQILGAYVQDQHAFSDWLKLTAGLRFDNYDDFGSSINPRAAAILTTPFKSNLKVLYGEAFRAPNFLELYDKNNPVDFGNPDLDAEKVRTIEVAYLHKLNVAEGSITYFHNTIEDQIVFGAPVAHPDNPLGAPGFENQDTDTDVSGLEVDLKINPHPQLSILATFTHFFEDSLAMGSQIASFIVNFRHRELNLNLNSYYRTELDLLPSQGAYMVVNLTARYAITPELSLMATAHNLLDKTYHTYTVVPLPEGVPNRTRTFTAGLRYSM